MTLELDGRGNMSALKAAAGGGTSSFNQRPGRQTHYPARTSLTLPSECVALSWAGLEDFISPRGRRGGGNRHFHGLPRSA